MCLKSWKSSFILEFLFLVQKICFLFQDVEDSIFAVRHLDKIGKICDMQKYILLSIVQTEAAAGGAL